MPLIPDWLRPLMGDADPAALARHVGYLSGIYTAGILLGAPLWGMLADRLGRARVLLVGLIGGLMPAALFLAHGSLPPDAMGSFRVLLYGLVLLIGILVGLEIPLVMRILKRHFSQRYALKELVSQVLTFDYLGALAVSLAARAQDAFVTELYLPDEAVLGGAAHLLRRA